MDDPLIVRALSGTKPNRFQSLRRGLVSSKTYYSILHTDTDDRRERAGPNNSSMKQRGRNLTVEFQHPTLRIIQNSAGGFVYGKVGGVDLPWGALTLVHPTQIAKTD